MTSTPPPPEFSYTWREYRDLNFWLWGCLQAAANYLRASHEQLVAAKGLGKASNLTEQLRILRLLEDITSLAEYHFVMTAGQLAKKLDRLMPLFPAMQASYDAAKHFRKEALYLRNMIEHADVNLAAEEKGKTRSGFTRKTSAGANIPGSEKGTVGALGTIVDANGHWLGGRLCVEQVVREVSAMMEVAKTIPYPYPPLANRPSAT